ncbi:MAG TPA: hypothetical protein VL264_05855 [Gaiella sp.]|jgi:hypothetical protein|nr:hypothetical protein [Gaiella sp.]
MTRPALLTFEILWYSGGPEHAPNRVIARDRVRKRDLTAAIRAACRMLANEQGSHDGYAHGFYVRVERDA